MTSINHTPHIFPFSQHREPLPPETGFRVQGTGLIPLYHTDANAWFDFWFNEAPKLRFRLEVRPVRTVIPSTLKVEIIFMSNKHSQFTSKTNIEKSRAPMILEGRKGNIRYFYYDAPQVELGYFYYFRVSYQYKVIWFTFNSRSILSEGNNIPFSVRVSFHNIVVFYQKRFEYMNLDVFGDFIARPDIRGKMDAADQYFIPNDRNREPQAGLVCSNLSPLTKTVVITSNSIEFDLYDNNTRLTTQTLTKILQQGEYFILKYQAHDQSVTGWEETLLVDIYYGDSANSQFFNYQTDIKIHFEFPPTQTINIPQIP